VNLPERKGFTIVHVHEEGQPCVLAGKKHAFSCQYRPTLRNRVRAFLHLRGF
jgi:hypothetical protein